MAKEFICRGKEYEVGGPGGETIGLPVKISGLPESIEVEGLRLQKKSAFHVSLVCIGKIIEKNKITDPNFRDSVVADFCEFTKINKIELLRYTGEFRFAAHNERRSLSAMCQVSNLDKFFNLLNQKYGLNMEVPPTHVTLYTLQPEKGIFLTTSEDMQKLTKPMDFDSNTLLKQLIFRD